MRKLKKGGFVELDGEVYEITGTRKRQNILHLWSIKQPRYLNPPLFIERKDDGWRNITPTIEDVAKLL